LSRFLAGCGSSWLKKPFAPLRGKHTFAEGWDPRKKPFGGILRDRQGQRFIVFDVDATPVQAARQRAACQATAALPCSSTPTGFCRL